LVTVLFVFAINITGEDPSITLPAIPRTVAWVLVLLAFVSLAWMILPNMGTPMTGQDLPFTTYLWETRKLDIYLQVGFIFAGVLGVLSLLSEDRTAHREGHA
jgi:hypothetical protein